MKNPTLISKIKSLEALTAEEKAELIALLNNTKKYGLVWEDKPEDVEELLRTHLPVLQEVPEKRILAKNLPVTDESEATKSTPQQPGLFDGLNPEPALRLRSGLDPGNRALSEAEAPSPDPRNRALSEAEAPNHILIEGDNLHALTTLTFTHEGKIDVIYIDPPYNTGNKDFKYNDSFVDREDSYRHSKWLSFMHKRLQIAKRLLSEKGVIFISIDDNEQSQLKLLCDEIFGDQNFIANISVINNLKGRSDDKYIATAHESLLIYKKIYFETIGIPVPDEYVGEYKLNDDKGFYRLQGLRKRGSGALKEDRPKMFYPFYYNKSINKLTLQRQNAEDIEILPKLSNGKDGRWRWGKETAIERISELVVSYVKTRNEFDVSQKDYLHKDSGQLKRIKPKSFWEGSEFSSDAGTKSLKEIIPLANFNNPKSVALIKFCLIQSASEYSTILDFFAGSGTTLHATMQLNAEDGGHRQCILVTNNENNIAEEVCYERNRRVIQGYSNNKGQEVPGLTNNNLRYYRTEFVGSAKTTKNKKELTKLATELLCIKEGIYTETDQMAGFVFNAKTARCFCSENKYMLVIYDEEMIEDLIPVITAIPKKHKIKIYVFAPGQYPFTEEFEEVLDKVELCALPDAIYKAYTSILPKKTSRPLAADENQPAENQASAEVDLFTTNTPEA